MKAEDIDNAWLFRNIEGGDPNIKVQYGDDGLVNKYAPLGFGSPDYANDVAAAMWLAEACCESSNAVFLIGVGRKPDPVEAEVTYRDTPNSTNSILVHAPTPAAAIHAAVVELVVAGVWKAEEMSDE